MAPIRKEIEAFSELMEAKLANRDASHPHGWLGEDHNFLINRLVGEFYELQEALDRFAIKPDEAAVAAVVDELVDIANFAMMIANQFVPLRTGNYRDEIAAMLRERRFNREAGSIFIHPLILAARLAQSPGFRVIHYEVPREVQEFMDALPIEVTRASDLTDEQLTKITDIVKSWGPEPWDPTAAPSGNPWGSGGRDGGY